MTREPTLPVAYRLIARDSVDSTNEEAKRLAVQGEDVAGDGTLVWARSQTAGRGRRGRPWFSPEGNLHCSLVLRPECPLAEAPQLGFVAALAIFDTIGSVCPEVLSASCKWPNDVLLVGRKVAGILLESDSRDGRTPDWVVLGVGINVLHYPEDSEFPATSLAAEGCGAVEVVDVLEAFCRHFLAWAGRWVEHGFAPIRETWLRRATPVGEKLNVQLEKESFSGIFADLDPDGALVLETDEGRRRITAGDVFPVAGGDRG